jgi:hypothetical protein
MTNGECPMTKERRSANDEKNCEKLLWAAFVIQTFVLRSSSAPVRSKARGGELGPFVIFRVRPISAIALAAILHANPAQAQATRTWVSGVGDDANPCSRTAPCKTFAGAISKTAPGGEINVLDPGGFGAVTITKSITIRSDHIEAGVLVSGTNGIVVSAGPTDKVVLEGLDIEGLGTGLHGVSILAGKEIYIIRCSIRHFTENGVNLASSTSGGHAFINDSLIGFNAGGVSVQGTANIASLTNTSVLSNTSFAVQANGVGNILGIQTSVLNNSPTGISLLNGGTAVSVGPSNLVTGAGAFSSTTLFK